MQLTELEKVVIREHYATDSVCTPEQLAQRLKITLGEILEAEKTALRRLADPERLHREGVDAAWLEDTDMTELERAVLRARYCPRRRRTPEEIAQAMNVTTAEVMEAEKQAMRKLEDPAHATAESLDALGLKRSA